MGKRNNSEKSGSMTWWQLSLFGVACTIGTGYFLGSGMAMQMAGGTSMILFALAATGTYLVFDVLSLMAAADPQQGSFRVYAKKAFGRWAGFSSGWVYWSSELLIMGSQLTALSLFTRIWFPAIPMWILAVGYAVLGLGVILLGSKPFERAEHVFALIKISAILMFLLIAVGAILHWIPGNGHPQFPTTKQAYMPDGSLGIWSAFIYAFYAFGGIEILGMMTLRLKDPQEMPKSGKVMIGGLAFIYIASLALALTLLKAERLQAKESPFQLALSQYDLPLVPHIFNAILIIAGFSTMVASLFAITTIMVTLAKDRDAPPIFAKTTNGNRKLPVYAIGFTTCGIGCAVVMALLLPDSLYAYITTAAGIMLLYNWLFILLSAGRLLELSVWGKIKRVAGMVLILAAIVGTVFHGTSRPGFWVSLLFIAVISCLTLWMTRKWRRGDTSGEKQARELVIFERKKEGAR
ncbi:amino acid permease [Paenibacillus whitsoniae]|uniref:Amino acid permease n=1 Tax=Paenibacillus whitsoniae TaxID=2496558 RepID=A0A430JIU9_9BACL|nr:amino acid permease [Paenibacillus whitsoniae]RTE10932.1 amino acid permease [Paenibacillus whitsoniae]